MKSYQFRGASPYYTNSFMLISAENNAVIIDPASEAAEYKQVLEEHGATLVAIFCTHGHFDHVTSAMELREAYGATLYCNPDDTGANQMFPMPYADKGYTDGEVIAVDEMQFKVYHTPGHTEGSVCLLCGDLFFTGDTIFRGSIGRTDFPGSDPQKMLASLRKFIALGIKGETHVLPGHEAFSTYEHELKTNWHLQNGCR